MRGQTGTPIPSHAVEYGNKGHGSLTIYNLSPEEMKAMRITKDGPESGLSKKVFLEQIAAGETISSVEKAWGMKRNTLPFWIGKWELKGINAEKARKLLAGSGVGMASFPSTANASAPASAPAAVPDNSPKPAVTVTPTVIKLPKDVADELQWRRNEGWTDYKIISHIYQQWGSGDPFSSMADFASQYNSPFLRALADGYEIEPTLEEKAIEWVIDQNCLQPGFSAAHVVVAIKNILGGQADAS